MKRWIAGVVVLVLIGVLAWRFYTTEDSEEVVGVEPVPSPSPEVVSVLEPEVMVPEIIDFENYNFDYADDEGVKVELNRMLEESGKVAFYLPNVDYVNASRGSGFGVVYAFKNPNPSGSGVDWNNYDDFRFDWVVNEESLESCGVGAGEAQGWIKRGQYSWGKMAHGWVDHVTVYFEFPVDLEPCSIKYDFVLKRDGEVWETKTLEFNLV